jgi:hypothetical protein
MVVVGRSKSELRLGRRSFYIVAQNTQKLEAVQRRSARFVMNNYQQTSSATPMLQTLQWPTLAERRARIKATMMYSIVNGLVAIPPTNRATHIYNNNKRPYSKIHSPICQNATI